MNFNYLCSQRFFSNLLFIFSSLALLGGYISENFFNIYPCQLCYYQRYLTILLVVLCFFQYFFKNFFKFNLLVLFCSWLFNLYQVGVEHHLWKGPESCTGALLDFKTSSSLSSQEQIKSFEKALSKKQVVRCDEVKWRIFSISVNIWHQLALLIFLFWGFIAWRRKSSES